MLSTDVAKEISFAEKEKPVLFSIARITLI